MYYLFFFPQLCISLFNITVFFSVCSQFSRGVYSMLGSVSPDSFDTFHSYSNTFQMPFVTPWFPEQVRKYKNIPNYVVIIIIINFFIFIGY